MCDLQKMLVVASDHFKNEPTVVSIATKHAQTMETTIMLGGRIEFNSYLHRRDAWDVMVNYGLWCKKLPGGFYEAGSHDPSNLVTRIGSRPTHAITEMAYALITGEKE